MQLAQWPSITPQPLARPQRGRSAAKPALDTLQITTKKQARLGADIKMPGTPFGPGTLREFQFTE
jgi:hypothetical protein